MNVTEMAEGVFFVEGPASNWVILVGDGSTTLIDTGYPADAPLGDILITHGHSDHIGSVRRLTADGTVTAWAAPEEIANITRQELHQIGIGQILPTLWRPRYLKWTVHAVRAGGLKDPGPSRLRPAGTRTRRHRRRADHGARHVDHGRTPGARAEVALGRGAGGSAGRVAVRRRAGRAARARAGRRSALNTPDVPVGRTPRHGRASTAKLGAMTETDDAFSIRRADAGDIPLLTAWTSAEPVVWIDAAQLAGELATGNYRPEWSWIAEQSRGRSGGA
jgi:hypothetical protein